MRSESHLPCASIWQAAGVETTLKPFPNAPDTPHPHEVRLRAQRKQIGSTEHHQGNDPVTQGAEEKRNV
eukprot:CAMPEP_0117576780 /NCGR_PEP_ID=MMETSP0784-20121206/63011_1 /TAXON_ID=39447 /ORGANISM="" /LENGTH=68 /DNA_ID=CAMNT_0005376117 /DNA_START=85 /DNA_END=291 /DNA_ORIENTATION=+